MGYMTLNKYTSKMIIPGNFWGIRLFVLALEIRIKSPRII